MRTFSRHKLRNNKTKTERKSMINKFDELTKAMAQSVSRRQALKKFGIGLAGMALACFGLASNARAAKTCGTDADCSSGQVCCSGLCHKATPDWCQPGSCCCYCTGPAQHRIGVTALTQCNPSYSSCADSCSAWGSDFNCSKWGAIP